MTSTTPWDGITTGYAAGAPHEHQPVRRVALVDLLDRLLATGVVITGDIVLSVADIDLVRISLRALVTSVSGAAEPGPGAVTDHGR